MVIKWRRVVQVYQVWRCHFDWWLSKGCLKQTRNQIQWCTGAEERKPEQKQTLFTHSYIINAFRQSLVERGEITRSKLDDRLGPSLTTRYHQTSTFVSSRVSVLTWMDVRGCIRSFMRLPLQRMSLGRGGISTQYEKVNGISKALLHGGIINRVSS